MNSGTGELRFNIFLNIKITVEFKPEWIAVFMWIENYAFHWSLIIQILLILYTFQDNILCIDRFAQPTILFCELAGSSDEQLIAFLISNLPLKMNSYSHDYPYAINAALTRRLCASLSSARLYLLLFSWRRFLKFINHLIIDVHTKFFRLVYICPGFSVIAFFKVLLGTAIDNNF